MANWVMAVLGTIGGSLFIFKLYCKLTCGIYKGKERLDGKTVIITGANAGIGMESAKDFAKRGARIIMACRDIKKAELVKDMIVSETGNNNIMIKHIDFTSFASVRKCANEILADEVKIDVLLNNAGALGIGFKQTEDGIDELMQANHFGPFLFTNILLGKIKESAPSRVVNVAALAYVIGEIDFDNLLVAKPKSYSKLYADSKLANILFTKELAEKLRGTGVTANCLHPGVFPSEIARGFNSFHQFIFHHFVKFFCKSIKEGAQTSIYLSVSPDVTNISGKYFEDLKIVGLKKKADDAGTAKKLWEISEDAVKLQANEIHY